MPRHSPRLFTLASLVVGLIVAVAPISASTKAVRAEPLEGTWETGSVPIAKLRAVLIATGSSTAQVTSFFRFFRMRNAWRNRLVFYREGGARFLAMSGWDPTKRSGPDDPDHGPYNLLPRQRFVARGVDPPTDRTRMLFSYTVTPQRLKLRFLSLKEPYPEFSKLDLARDTMLMRILAAFPYRRVG